MLRAPRSFYENKRSSTLLKYKMFIDDEAVVVGHELGTGKYNSVMGKLVVKWMNGKGNAQFKVGSGFNDDQRRTYKTTFPIGTIIKVKYFELTNTNKPRFPVFLGIRSSKDL
jgi:DNA ligase-1